MYIIKGKITIPLTNSNCNKKFNQEEIFLWFNTLILYQVWFQTFPYQILKAVIDEMAALSYAKEVISKT